MRRLSDARARQMSLDAINEHGALLVYPLNNRPEPPSVWQKIHPKSPMVWEWDDDGDTRVAQLWHIRAELSASDEVVYAKWYQGRATFFSKPVFTDLLAYLKSPQYLEELDPERAEVMEVLGSDSPQSTKQLKAALGLEGRLNEPTYNKRLKPLWTHLLLVGYGEFEDSSFPSLGIGASHTLFESLWKKAHKTDAEEAGERLMNLFGEHSAFWKWTMRIRHESLDKDSRSSYI
jgi:hypothetical protein